MAKLNIPTRIHAGDTLAFNDEVYNYSSKDSWLIRYVLVTGINKYQFDSTANHGRHDFYVSASTTSKWVSDSYKWAAYAVSGDDRHTIATGTIEVLPDLTASAADQRHHVERMLKAIEAMLEGKASIDQQTYSVNGRSVGRYTFEELIVLRDKYKGELVNLKRAERVANGLPAGNKIFVRFN